jgi:hypothetical protein
MDDTIDVFFSYSINYIMFHSLTIVYKKNCQPEMWMCSWISKCVQIRGHVHTITSLLCCYPGRQQPWKLLHSLIFLKKADFRWAPCCSSFWCFVLSYYVSLPPVVCGRTHVLFTLFVFACVWWCLTPVCVCVWGGGSSSKLPVSLNRAFFDWPFSIL